MLRSVALVLFVVVACSNGANKSAPARVERDGGDVTARPLSIEGADKLLWPANRTVTLRVASDDEKAALAELVGALWRGEEPDPRLARAARMQLELWEIEGRRYWAVREPDDDRRGAGSYVVRAEAFSGPAVLLEAPHAYFDTGTGAIAARMFLAADSPAALRGLFSNSLHRYQQEPGVREKRDENPADVGHNEAHGFQAATAAALEAGAAAIVQIHGFDADARADQATASADAVVSGGRSEGATPASTRVAGAIATELGARVLRYPEDTKELGGTLNVQGRLARKRGVAFVHVELGVAIRDRLRDDTAACLTLARAVVTAVEAPR
jgi:hypothetical protein